MSSDIYNVKQTVQLIDSIVNPSGDTDLFVITHMSPCASYGVLGRIMIKQHPDKTALAMTLNGIGPRKPMAISTELDRPLTSKDDVYSALACLIYNLKEPLKEIWHIELPDKDKVVYKEIRKAFSHQDLYIQQILFSNLSTLKETI